MAADEAEQPTMHLHSPQRLACMELAKRHGAEVTWADVRAFIGDTVPGGLPEDPSTDPVLQANADFVLTYIRGLAEAGEATEGPESRAPLWAVMQRWFGEDADPVAVMQSGLARRIAFLYERAERYADARRIYEAEWERWQAWEVQDRWATVNIIEMLAHEGKDTEARARLVDYHLRRQFAGDGKGTLENAYWGMAGALKKRNEFKAMAEVRRQLVLAGSEWRGADEKMHTVLAALAAVDPSLELGPWVGFDDDGAAWLDSVSRIWQTLPRWTFTGELQERLAAFAGDPANGRVPRARALALLGDVDGVVRLFRSAESLSPEEFRFFCDVLVLTYGHPEVLSPSSAAHKTYIGGQPWGKDAVALLAAYDPRGEMAARRRQAMRDASADVVVDGLQRRLTALIDESPDAAVTAVWDLRSKPSYTDAYLIVHRLLRNQERRLKNSIKALEKSADPATPEAKEQLAAWSTQRQAVETAVGRLLHLHESAGDAADEIRDRVRCVGLLVSGIEAMAEQKREQSAADLAEARRLAPGWLRVRPVLGSTTLDQLEVQTASYAFAEMHRGTLNEENIASYIALLERYRSAKASPSMGEFMNLTATRPRDLQGIATMESLMGDHLLPAERDILRLHEAEFLAIDGKWDRVAGIVATYKDDERFRALQTFVDVRMDLDALILKVLQAGPEAIDTQVSAWSETHAAERDTGNFPDREVIRWTAERLHQHAEDPALRVAATKALIVLAAAPELSSNVVASMIMSRLTVADDMSPYVDVLVDRLTTWPDANSIDRIRSYIMAGAPGDGPAAKAQWYAERIRQVADRGEHAILVLHAARYLYDQHEAAGSLALLAQDEAWPEAVRDERLLLIGLGHYRLGDIEAARDSFAALRQDFPESVNALKSTFLLSCIHTALGDATRARELQQVVLAEAPASELAGLIRLFAGAEVRSPEEARFHCDMMVLCYGDPGARLPSSAGYRGLNRDSRYAALLATGSAPADGPAILAPEMNDVRERWLMDELRSIMSMHMRLSSDDAVALIRSVRRQELYTPAYARVYEELGQQEQSWIRKIELQEKKQGTAAAVPADEVAVWAANQKQIRGSLDDLLAMSADVADLDAGSAVRVQSARLMLDAYQAFFERRYDDCLSLTADAREGMPLWLQSWQLMRHMAPVQLEVQARCRRFHEANPNVVAADKMAEYTSLLQEFRASYKPFVLTLFLNATGTQPTDAGALAVYKESMAAVFTPDEVVQLEYLEARLLAHHGKLTEATAIWERLKSDPRFAGLETFIAIRTAMNDTIAAALAKDPSTLGPQVAAWCREHREERREGELHDHMTTSWTLSHLRTLAGDPDQRIVAVTAMMSLLDAPNASAKSVASSALTQIENGDQAPFVDLLYKSLLHWPDDSSVTRVVDIIMAGAPGATNAEKLAWFSERAKSLDKPDDRSVMLMHVARYLYRENEFVACQELLSQDLQWAKSIQDSRLLIVGMIHYRNGDVTGALAAFDALRRDYPKSEYRLQATFVAGWINASEGNNEVARKLLEEVKTLDPKSEYADKASRILLGIQP